MDPLGALGINGGFLIAQLVNFGIIFVLFTALAWRPIVRRLDERAMKIAKSLEDAEYNAKARAEAEAEAARIIEQARREAARLADEARGRGDESAKSILAEAQREADAIKSKARADAEQQRNQLLAEMRGQVAALAMAAAQHLLGESLDEKRQQKLVADFFANVPAGARNLGGTVEVTSALPLSDAEQRTIKDQTGAQEIHFRVDPTILGGVIVRAGDRVIDGSVRAGLREMAARMN